MKLYVPFYQQDFKNSCGIFALKMVLNYFGKNIKTQDITDKIEAENGKGISTWQLAIGAAKYKFIVKIYSAVEKFDEKLLTINFYKKSLPNNYFTKLNQWENKAKNLGVKRIIKHLTLNEILYFVSNKKVPIILLNWNIIKGKKGFQGHFVPLIGYDKNNVYIHSQGLNNPKKFMKIPRDLFDIARKSKGTEEDILLISNK